MNIPRTFSNRRAQGSCLFAGLALLGIALALGAGAVVMFRPEMLPEGVGLKKLPMTVSFRKALLSQGAVAKIENPTGETLHNVRIVGDLRDAGKQTELLEETWAPGHSRELGWLQGWRFETDDTLTISASGHRKRVWTVPELDN